MKSFNPGDLVRFNPKFFSGRFPLLAHRPTEGETYNIDSIKADDLIVVLAQLDQCSIDALPDSAEHESPQFWCLDRKGISVISPLSLVLA